MSVHLSNKKNSSLAIERFGLEALPEHLKTTTWKEYFIMQSAFSVNAGNFLVPAFAVIQGHLPLGIAIISTVLGACLAFLLVSFLAMPGAKKGLPAQYAIRAMLGYSSSRYVASPIRTITSLYWFSVQTIGGTIVLQEMAKKLFNLALPFIPTSISFAISMSVLALVGFEAVKKVIKLFVPLLLAGQILMVYLLFETLLNSQTTFIWSSSQSWNTGTAFFYASLAFVQYVSGVSASSDMARYAKSTKAAFWGIFSGNAFGFFMTALLGATSAALTNELNPFITTSNMTNSVSIMIIIFLCAMVSMISINLNNAYTGGYSLLNSLHRLTRVQCAILFGVVAVFLCSVPSLVTEAKSFISLLGMFIIPISAVIVADYWFTIKANFQEEHLQKIITYSWNKPGLISIITGAVIYSVIPESFSPGFSAFIITIICYRLLNVFLHTTPVATKEDLSL